MLREPIDLKSMTTEVLSSEKYLTLSAKERANIFQAKIVPPVLGSEDFGKIQAAGYNLIIRVLVGISMVFIHAELAWRDLNHA
jgi:hypothetical protein